MLRKLQGGSQATIPTATARQTAVTFRGQANSTSLERRGAGEGQRSVGPKMRMCPAYLLLERPDLARYLPLPAGTDGVAGMRVERLSRDTADWLAFTAHLKGRGKQVFATEEAIHAGPGVDAAGTATPPCSPCSPRWSATA